MKKVLIAVFTILIILVLTGCQKNNEPKLEDFAEAFITAGYEVNINEKPFYIFVDAIDGFLFYVDDNRTTVLEFESIAELESSIYKNYDSTNGRFTIESDYQEIIDIFNNIGSLDK